MKKVTVFIERGNDNTYSVYLGENDLSYGIIGSGDTVKDAIEDFYNSYEEMRVYYKESGKEFEEVEFEFKYDVASFLAYYSDKLSLAGLERITGVNQGQLSHYITGHSKPRQATIEKMQKELHKFAEELRQVSFV